MTSFRRINKNQDSIIAQADHVTCGVECWEVKACASAVLSSAKFHLKVWSDQQWKISDTVKITLAFQNVKGNIAQSLNVSVSESTAWSQGHNIFINYFNNAAPAETKSIYQFTNADRKEEINYFREGQRQRSKVKKPQSGKGSMGSSSISQNLKRKPKEKGKTCSVSAWPGVRIQWS